MKISASIYSERSKQTATLVRELEECHIDMVHIDCMDEPAVFDDIRQIRSVSGLPIDLHLITSHPLDYQQLLADSPVDLLTIQLENLNGSDELPKSGFGKLGLALTSSTGLDAFNRFADRCDFILLMATEPGKSGGAFEKKNFRRIREFKKNHPDKQVHVDGGVNAEVSFILRNLGVNCAVSGSYLFNQRTLGSAMLNLRHSEPGSHFKVIDFMLGPDETPTVERSSLSLENVLRSIDGAQMAFTVIIDDNGKPVGIISNADVRKGLLKNIHDLNNIDAESLINRAPVLAREDMTVSELLHFIREQTIPINYLPIVDERGKLTGSLTFNDLIKGES